MDKEANQNPSSSLSQQSSFHQRGNNDHHDNGEHQEHHSMVHSEPNHEFHNLILSNLTPKEQVEIKMPTNNEKIEENKSVTRQSRHNSSRIIVPTCRICLLTEADDAGLGDLINICKCRGSIALMHFACLKDTLEKQFGKRKKSQFESHRDANRDENKVRDAGERTHVCEICGEKYTALWECKISLRPSSQICGKKKLILILLIVSLFGFVGFLISFIIFLQQSENLVRNANQDHEQTVFVNFISLMSGFGMIVSFFFLIFCCLKVFFIKAFFISKIWKIEETKIQIDPPKQNSKTPS